MVSREIVPGVVWVGALDFDRRIFDELIPLPNGTSYNAYLIRGSEKTALIDTVDPTKEFDLISNLVKLGIERIDYIIINHAEQDHAGSLPMVLEFFPDAMVVTNEKCRDLLIALLHLPADKFRVVKDRETLSLGDRTLEFILTPVDPLARDAGHLPAGRPDPLPLRPVRVPYGDKRPLRDRPGGLLYPGKAVLCRDHDAVPQQYQRPSRKDPCPEIDLIAPSHGPVHKNPHLILDAYADWVSDTVKNEVVIPYVSMHGSTQKMVEHFTDALIARGVTVRPFNLTHTDIGELALSLVDAATVVIATPTVLFGPHPQIVYATYLANMLKPKMRYASVIGSYGWGGKAPETIVKMLDHVKVEVLEPVMVKGLPDEKTLAALDRLADDYCTKAQGEQHPVTTLWNAK